MATYYQNRMDAMADEEREEHREKGRQAEARSKG
jgi:hypothetical protein